MYVLEYHVRNKKFEGGDSLLIISVIKRKINHVQRALQNQEMNNFEENHNSFYNPFIRVEKIK